MSARFLLIQAWFNRLERREQHVLIWGTLLSAGLLIYFLLWQPWLDAYRELKNRVAAQQATVTWMQSTAQHIQQLRAKLPNSANIPKNQSLLTILEQSFQGESWTKIIKRLEAKNDTEVRVTMEQVSFTELLTWLAMLQNQFSIQVVSLNVTRLTAPDSVKAQLTLAFYN